MFVLACEYGGAFRISEHGFDVRPPRQRGTGDVATQKLKVTLKRANRGAAIAVGFNHDAPFVAYS